MQNNFKNIIKVPTANVGRLLGLAGAFGFGSWALYNSFFTVDGGHTAIVFNRLVGIKPYVYGEGIHFIIPWFEWPIDYHTRAKLMNIPTSTGSKDLQMVSVTVRILSAPRISELPTIYRRLGMNPDERVLPSVAKEVLKSVMAQYNASQLITMRHTVGRQIEQRIRERASEFGLQVEDISIVELSFGKEYATAIEKKQVAQQEAERAKFIVERAREKKREIIAKADGERRAAIEFNETLRNDPHGNFLELKKIEAAQDIATALAQGSNRIYLNSDYLLFQELLDTNPKE